MPNTHTQEPGTSTPPLHLSMLKKETIMSNTLADTPWNTDEHYLAEAEHPDYRLVTLLQETYDGKIRCMFNREGETFLVLVRPKNLTLTGRRYRIVEE